MTTCVTPFEVFVNRPHCEVKGVTFGEQTSFKRLSEIFCFESKYVHLFHKWYFYFIKKLRTYTVRIWVSIGWGWKEQDSPTMQSPGAAWSIQHTYCKFIGIYRSVSQVYTNISYWDVQSKGAILLLESESCVHTLTVECVFLLLFTGKTANHNLRTLKKAKVGICRSLIDCMLYLRSTSQRYPNLYSVVQSGRYRVKYVWIRCLLFTHIPGFRN